jgi:hypothetical protein
MYAFLRGLLGGRGGMCVWEDKVPCKYIRKLLQVLYESILQYSNQQG